jgi:hypothetical protein
MVKIITLAADAIVLTQYTHTPHSALLTGSRKNIALSGWTFPIRINSTDLTVFSAYVSIII